MAAEGLRELREEAGELMRTLEAVAVTAEGFKVVISLCVLLAHAVPYLLDAAGEHFFPGAPPRLTGGICSVALALYLFLEAHANRLIRRLFLERRSELAERVRDLRTRLAALENGLGAGAEDEPLLSRAEELRAYVDSFPDLGGSWSQLFYHNQQSLLGIAAGCHFSLGLEHILRSLL